MLVEQPVTRELEVGRLRALLADSTAAVPADWRLSVTEEKIFRALLANDFVGQPLIAEVAGTPTARSSRVHMHRIRTKLTPRGVSIETVHGRGWRLIGRDHWRAILDASANEGVN